MDASIWPPAKSPGPWPAIRDPGALKRGPRGSGNFSVARIPDPGPLQPTVEPDQLLTRAFINHRFLLIFVPFGLYDELKIIPYEKSLNMTQRS